VSCVCQFVRIRLTLLPLNIQYHFKFSSIIILNGLPSSHPSSSWMDCQSPFLPRVVPTRTPIIICQRRIITSLATSSSLPQLLQSDCCRLRTVLLPLHPVFFFLECWNFLTLASQLYFALCHNTVYFMNKKKALWFYELWLYESFIGSIYNSIYIIYITLVKFTGTI